MNKTNGKVDGFKIGLGLLLLAVLTGCIGVVGPGGGGVYVPGPEVTVFGGGFERGHDVRGYSARGFASRGGRR